MLVLWPVSTSIGPLVVFVITNGMSNGGFFSTMPTVVGNVFGSARVPVAMGMIVTSWAGGYLMVCCLAPSDIHPSRLTEFTGRPDCGLYPRCVWRRRQQFESVSPIYFLCRRDGSSRSPISSRNPLEDRKAIEKEALNVGYMGRATGTKTKKKNIDRGKKQSSTVATFASRPKNCTTFI